jgi:membrane-associated phospholipid phosphatase
MRAPSPRWLVAGGLACLIILGILATGNWTPPLPAVPTWFEAHAPWVIDGARVLNIIGRGVVLIPLTIAIAITLFAFRHRAWAAYVIGCGIAGLALVESIKAALDRPRPTYALLEEASGSFPSGHAASGIYCWVVFGLTAWCLVPRIGRVLGVAAMVVGVLLGPSRVVLGVHYWPDVLGGWAAGAGVTLLAGAAIIGVRGGARERG